jgi:DNA-binding NtrC family response regulator
MTPGNGNHYLHPTRSPLPLGRVLLLDEDENNLPHFTILLERMAYAVRAFASYQEAETCLDHEPFDFLVVSPAFEAHPLIGFTLAGSLHTPEVVLTRCLEMKCCVAAMQLGASEFLEKPLTSAEFEHLVTTHCQPRQGEMFGRTSDRLSVRRGVSPSHRATPLQRGEGCSSAPNE